MKIKNTIKCLILAASFGLVFQVSAVEASAVLKDEIINLVNAEREKLGLNPLVENEILNKAAFSKAQDMIGHNYFSHTSPSGVDPWYWFEQAGYAYKYAGENLGMDFNSAASVHRAWMKSKTHKENIVSEKFQEIGVAVLSGVMDGRETKVAVQLFGTKLSGVDLNSGGTVEKIKGESGNSIEVKINKASFSPWEGSFEDEVLVFSEIEGEPQKVELIVKDQSYNLEKLRDGMYMNLISLKDIDLAQDQLVIKAVIDGENSIFYQVPKDSFNEYLAKKGKSSDDEQEEIIALAPTESKNKLSQALYSFSPNNLLIIIMGVFLVTIANIWILEKEEEKLLSQTETS